MALESEFRTEIVVAIGAVVLLVSFGETVFVLYAVLREDTASADAAAAAAAAEALEDAALVVVLFGESAFDESLEKAGTLVSFSSVLHSHGNPKKRKFRTAREPDLLFACSQSHGKKWPVINTNESGRNRKMLSRSCPKFSAGCISGQSGKGQIINMPRFSGLAKSFISEKHCCSVLATGTMLYFAASSIGIVTSGSIA